MDFTSLNLLTGKSVHDKFFMNTRIGAATMNKSDLISALAEKEGLQNKEALGIVNMMFDGLTKTLKEDGGLKSEASGISPSDIMIHIPEGIPRQASESGWVIKGCRSSKWGRN